MFETDEERSKLLQIRQQELLILFENTKILQIFYNKNTFRVKKAFFNKIKKQYKFIKVAIKDNTFKVQDIIKISKLNSDLFYIDQKNSVIFTLDLNFANWCNITGSDINSIRSI